MYWHKIKQNPPGEPGGIKQLKTNYLFYDLVRSLTVQKCIDRADLRVVVFVCLHLVVAVEVLDIGDRVVQF